MSDYLNKLLAVAKGLQEMRESEANVALKNIQAAMTPLTREKMIAETQRDVAAAKKTSIEGERLDTNPAKIQAELSNMNSILDSGDSDVQKLNLLRKSQSNISHLLTAGNYNRGLVQNIQNEVNGAFMELARKTKTEGVRNSIAGLLGKENKYVKGDEALYRINPFESELTVVEKKSPKKEKPVKKSKAEIDAEARANWLATATKLASSPSGAPAGSSTAGSSSTPGLLDKIRSMLKD